MGKNKVPKKCCQRQANLSSVIVAKKSSKHHFEELQIGWNCVMSVERNEKNKLDKVNLRKGRHRGELDENFASHCARYTVRLRWHQFVFCAKCCRLK